MCPPVGNYYFKTRQPNTKNFHSFIVDSIPYNPPPSTDQTNTTGCSIHSNSRKVLCGSQREKKDMCRKMARMCG